MANLPDKGQADVYQQACEDGARKYRVEPGRMQAAPGAARGCRAVPGQAMRPLGHAVPYREDRQCVRRQALRDT
jgi:hypothetical protein